jgi:DNA mismatch repair protein MutL
MADIRQLPPSVVNKIAAGEVIERPASVIKELVENSIDAGATRIDISVQEGGSALVRVADNGSGIHPDQLLLAVASHATSKIHTADDLFRVGTLGFRGEALASIAEVSRLVIRSRQASSDSGAELEVVAGIPGQVVPCGSPVGTTIEVHNLFFNTPVRRKFLRSTQTEIGHATEAFTRIALAAPGVHFTLRHNDRAVYDLAPSDQWRARIAAFFGQDLADNLIAVDSRDGQVHLAGYVANPSHSRSHPRMQYLFLNGRHIRDRSLQHALGEAYRGLLLTGRYPIAFLAIELPADAVDVNVHPTKLEVRFQDSGRLYSQLLGTLRTRFLTTDLTARLQPVADASAEAHDPRKTEQLRQELVDWAKGQLPGGAAEPSAGADFAPEGVPAWDSTPARPTHAPLELNRLDRRWPAPPGTSPRFTERDSRPAEPGDPRPAPHVPWPAAPPALQVHNRYLIAESEDGVVVIDQHALHERILYEELRTKVAAGAMEAQSLLVPEPVDLAGAEAAAVLEQQDLLAQLGVKIEPFGGNTVLVVSYPAMLATLNPAEVLRDLVDRLLSGGKSPEPADLLDDLLHMIACKAAIKAGDRLTPTEIAALLQQRHLAHDSHHCPHGRPAALVFTREELDKQFKRI